MIKIIVVINDKFIMYALYHHYFIFFIPFLQLSFHNACYMFNKFLFVTIFCH